MSLRMMLPRQWQKTALISTLALLVQSMPAGAQTRTVAAPSTKTPVQHVIVIIGENRTFDHVFATYQPTIPGETIDNLLSKGIIRADGSPGPNYGFALQFSAVDTFADGYQISPGGLSLYANLPPPVVGDYVKPPFPTMAEARMHENGLAAGY